MFSRFALILLWLLSFATLVEDCNLYAETLSDTDPVTPVMSDYVATLYTRPLPSPFVRVSVPDSVPLYYSPSPLARRPSVKAKRAGRARVNHKKALTMVYQFMGRMGNRYVKSVKPIRPTKTVDRPIPSPFRVTVSFYPVIPTPVSRSAGHRSQHALSTPDFGLTTWSAYKFLIAWVAITFSFSIFVFTRLLICTHLANGFSDPTTSDVPTPHFTSPTPNPTPDERASPSPPSPPANLHDLSFAASTNSSSIRPALKDVPLLPVSDSEPIALNVHTSTCSSALVDVASALSAGIDAKNRVEGETDMKGTPTGGKIMEPAVSTNSIGVALLELCQHYETYRTPNLAKYPVEDRGRVRQREVRLVERLQELQRRRDKKEGREVALRSLAWMVVWTVMMKHKCIPGGNGWPEDGVVKGIAGWKADGAKRGKRVAKKVRWKDEV
ncbi:hypothetical protein RSOLAG1IB_09844 [Rhizoctonia solani AG-1 IB]|uniref:Uncharacterized protein n=1 Tax=Thanatephorus cucumeris (strain AG1-IB / isolate 7/3/14) TaxID=1108050 RepID=A0A0B7FTD0_THACB|nr:hypothetical protein RSOLAG1IB_09844 [Rhizoctonia solani AG-1 IB]